MHLEVESPCDNKPDLNDQQKGGVIVVDTARAVLHLLRDLGCLKTHGHVDEEVYVHKIHIHIHAKCDHVETMEEGIRTRATLVLSTAEKGAEAGRDAGLDGE